MIVTGNKRVSWMADLQDLRGFNSIRKRSKFASKSLMVHCCSGLYCCLTQNLEVENLKFSIGEGHALTLYLLSLTPIISHILRLTRETNKNQPFL